MLQTKCSAMLSTELRLPGVVYCFILWEKCLSSFFKHMPIHVTTLQGSWDPWLASSHHFSGMCTKILQIISLKSLRNKELRNNDSYNSQSRPKSCISICCIRQNQTKYVQYCSDILNLCKNLKNVTHKRVKQFGQIEKKILAASPKIAAKHYSQIEYVTTVISEAGIWEWLLNISLLH